MRGIYIAERTKGRGGVFILQDGQRGEGVIYIVGRTKGRGGYLYCRTDKGESGYFRVEELGGGLSSTLKEGDRVVFTNLSICTCFKQHIMMVAKCWRPPPSFLLFILCKVFHFPTSLPLVFDKFSKLP